MSQGQLIDPGPAAPKRDTRREKDAYYTPHDATRSLLERVPGLRGGELLDPSCGDGRMALQLCDRFRLLHLNDIDPKATAAAHALFDDQGVDSLLRFSQRDAADPLLYLPAPDIVVTNPPFSHAGHIAHQALQRTRRGVALLVRSTWLETHASSARAPRGERRWLAGLPPTRVIFLGRLSFTGSGSDSAGYVWAIWLREGMGQPWQRGTVEIEGWQGAQQSFSAAAAGNDSPQGLRRTGEGEG